MMKVFAPPKEVGPAPEYDPNATRSREDFLTDAERDWLDRLTRWCREHGRGNLRGRIAFFPQGDGCAQYMVFAPGQLIHIALGDAWHFPYIERLTMTDIRRACR